MGGEESDVGHGCWARVRALRKARQTPLRVQPAVIAEAQEQIGKQRETEAQLELRSALENPRATPESMAYAIQRAKDTGLVDEDNLEDAHIFLEDAKASEDKRGALDEADYRLDRAMRDRQTTAEQLQGAIMAAKRDGASGGALAQAERQLQMRNSSLPVSEIPDAGEQSAAVSVASARFHRELMEAEDADTVRGMIREATEAEQGDGEGDQVSAELLQEAQGRYDALAETEAVAAEKLRREQELRTLSMDEAAELTTTSSV